MDLLILQKSLERGGGPVASYRGTERAHPVHFANLPETHVANQLFFWFVEEGGALGVVHDLKKAKQLVELLNLFGDTVFYELVQVETGRGVVAGKGGFLGFDVSSGFRRSLVREVLLRLPGEQSAAAAESAVGELSRLHQRYFAARLNDHQLFQEYDDAEFCLRTARALDTVRPGWVEGTDWSKYAVTSLYKVL